MTDERGIGPLPPAELDGPRVFRLAEPTLIGVRVAGAILAAIFAAIALVLAVRVNALVARDPLSSPIAMLFSPDGVAHGKPLGSWLVWSVGPVAAAIAGFVFAVPAVRGIDGSGLWMGAATYAAAIGAAPIVFLSEAATEGVDVLRNLGIVPFMWLLAGAALGPLYVVCLVAGPIWAFTLRLTREGSARERPSARTFSLWPIIALGIAILCGWAFVTATVAVVGTGTFD